MDKMKLRIIMMLNGENNSDLANLLHITPQTVSAKLNETNGAEFTQSEIFAIKDHYELTPDQVDEIFFNKKVS
ncbi:MAG: XRE family transcriptional regulator [Clostridia bacterium]|nr:XRE family transcriptional regulator [Clostridia bacterium]